MPRPLRPALIHGTYHITAHGVSDEDIFRDDADRVDYLSLLQKHASAGRVHVLAYVLMSNHVHLVLSTTDTNLSSFIQRVHGLYGARLNRKYGRKGHLFGSRFYSDRLETDEHLLASSRYLHRNPVKARIVERPEHYPWSSYRVYLGLESDGFVDPRPVLLLLGADRAAAARAYESFVLGEPDLARLMQSVHNGHMSVDHLVKAIADLLNLLPTAVEHRTRGSPARRLTLRLLHEVLGWSHHRMAAEMAMTATSVASALAEDGRSDRDDQAERARFEEILRQVSKIRVSAP